MKRMLMTLRCMVPLLLPVLSHATAWHIPPTYPRAFIANNGQFNGRNLGPWEVLYAIDNGPFQVYFSREGITYRFDEKYREKHEGKEQDAKEELREITRKLKKGPEPVRMKSDVVQMAWVNGAAGVDLQAEGLRPDYFNYAMGSNDIHFDQVPAYTRLTYKNLWPGIDAVFSFDEQEGFNYSFVLAPGADPSLIRMRYETPLRWSLAESGGLRFRTRFGPMTHSAPKAFTGSVNGQTVDCAFEKTGGVVSFRLAAYDRSQSLVIDPWVVFPPSPNSNKVWEVETDNAGNVYAYAGDMPFTLRKYGPGGNLIWSYLTPWDSAGFWVGGMITHPNGDTYMTSGSNGEIRKINPAGVQQWYNNPNALTSYEYWSLAFSCDLSRLVIGGSRAAFSIPFPVIRGTIMEINLSNGAILTTREVGFGNIIGIPPNIQEASSICVAPNGNYYFLTLDSVGAIDVNLTAPIFKVSTGYSFDYYIPGYGFGTKQPISAIRASAAAFYTTNGNTVVKHDLLTGAVLATAAIPNGLNTPTFLGRRVQGNGGLDLDSCGNVYAGSGTGVYKFDAQLNLLGSASTSGPVYDVDVSASGEVVASGANFVASLSMGSCQVYRPGCVTILTASVVSTNVDCAGNCTGSATASSLGGLPPLSYAWSNGATSAVISGLCAGTYTVIVSDANGLSDSVTIQITAPANALSAITNVVNANCGATNGAVSVNASGGTAPYAYLWSPFGATTAGLTGVGAGNYTVLITDNNGCTFSTGATVGNSNGPSLTSVTTAPATCGLSNGTAAITVNGGAPPFTYSWSPNVSSGPTATGLAPGIYTVQITDAAGCVSDTVLAVGAIPGFTLQPNTTSATCGLSTGTASVTVNGGIAPFTYTWTPNVSTGATATGLATGAYTVLVTDSAGCTSDTLLTVVDIPGFSLQPTSAAATCGLSNGTAAVTVNGGAAPFVYSWTPNVSSGTAASGLPAGAYTVQVTDSIGCVSDTILTVADIPLFTAQLSSTPSCTTGNASAFVTITGGTTPYTYAWLPSGGNGPVASGLGNGWYRVTTGDANGCTRTDSVFVVIFTPPVADAGIDQSITPGSGIALQASGGLSYVWTPATGLSCTSCSAPFAAPDSSTRYCVTVTDNNGCTDDDCIQVTVREDIQCGEVYVPNVFRPAEETNPENSRFCVYNPCLIALEFAVYNRWGEKVFETSDAATCWDGTFKGQDLPSGTYVYGGKAKLRDGRDVTLKGNVTLLR